MRKRKVYRDAEAEARSDLIYYGALSIINRAEGTAHRIPEKYRKPIADAEAAAKARRGPAKEAEAPTVRIQLKRRGT